MPVRAKHPLAGLLLAQFTGAFNDNAWKLCVALLAMRAIASSGGADSGLAAEPERAWLMVTGVAFLVLTLPLLLFSLPAGAVADRVSKRTVIISMKCVEVLLLVVAAAALMFAPSAWVAPLIVLGLLGVQSSFFGPAKFGILPELLPHDRLSAGNGALEMWSFLAIVLGTASGGALLAATGDHPWQAAGLLAILGVVGILAALFVPRVQAARDEGGFRDSVNLAWQTVREDRVIRLTMCGMALYYAIASLLCPPVLVYAKRVLLLSDSLSGVPLAAFGVGVGVGSLLAGRLSAGKVEYGLIPMGAAGLTLSVFLLGLVSPGFTGTIIFMSLMGVSSGLIVVPFHALLQWKSPADRRGAVIALGNVFLYAGVVGGTAVGGGLAFVGLSTRAIMICAAVVTLAGTLWAIYLLPDAFLRCILIILKGTFYRVRVLGAKHVPEEGGALLVPNHVSFVDGVFLITSLDRPVRFIVEASYFHRIWLKPFMKALGAIPISATRGPRVVLRALRDAGEYLDNGEIVCIFAEGQMTRTGMMLPFRRGFERIAKGRSAPIIPVYLDRLWGSIFSRERGRFITKLPRRLPYPVTICYGDPLSSESSVTEVRRAVQELGRIAWEDRKKDQRPLHHFFIRQARRRPMRFAFADQTRPHITRIEALAGALALARALHKQWKRQECVGILLPPSVGAALANIAASLSGRTSVNLNYTAGPSGLASAVRQAGLETVVTSRDFLEKAKLEVPEGLAPIWIDEVIESIGLLERVRCAVLACLAPIRSLERASGAVRRSRLENVATIIFSSGSTGEPKGVLLTQYNISSNVEACLQIIPLRGEDRLLGILPTFHSFGYLALWLSANSEMGTVFHPNPLDAASIGELIQRYGVTALLATPTFLQVYLRRCTPGQFGSLHMVLTGAEKLPDRLTLAFEEHFGIRPLEGYGTTECSPVIAASTLDFRAPGLFQPGSKRGFVGQALPGVAVRIVNPDSFEPLNAGEEGMIIVKGPNVMKGYLGRDDLTAEVLRDGWYITGDIGFMDEDGFLKITDRLSRFAKIGGEMVPLGRVEDALQEAAERDEQVFAVTSVPDEKKGEKLAVLHTLEEEELPEILEKLDGMGLPNLFIPKREQFIQVEEIPVLGTGKVDLRELRRVAEERLGAKE